MNRISTHTFRGKRWRIDWSAIPASENAIATCDGPNVKGKSIRVDARYTDETLLYALLHEGIHACQWDIDEDAVHAMAHDLSRLVWRVGFRIEED